MEPPATGSGKECYFTSLPMELHIRIRNELLKDPSTAAQAPVEFNFFKSLRLVCKLFDFLWSPVVLVNFVLFPDNINQEFDLECIRRLVDGKSDLRFNTVTLKNWHYLNTEVHYFFEMLKKLWVADWKTVMLQMSPTLILAVLVNLVMFFGAPRKIVPRLQTFSAVLRARRYARKIPRKLQLPNLSCVRLIIRPNNTRWEVYWTTRLLAMVPNLTELVVLLTSDADMAYISEHLKSLRTLKKFTLQTHGLYSYSPPGSRHKLSFFSAVIARNPNLTHLRFMLSEDTRCDLSEMLRNIKPLRLEHVAIDCFCDRTDALLPHIQSLSSLETRLIDGKNGTTLYSMLSRALVFPSTISADLLENDLYKYLERHPGVTNLSICHRDRREMLRVDYELSKIIIRHSCTLRKLKVTSHMLRALDAEVALLKCAQLIELVLTRSYTCCNWVATANENLEDEKHVLDIAARLNRSLTVVIKDRQAFFACVQYCRDSENHLLHDLAGRIMYDKSDEIRELYVF